LPVAEWSWELSALSSIDHDSESVPGIVANRPAILSALAAIDPAQALNVFQDGPGATRTVLDSLFSNLDQKFRGQLNSATGFVRGPIGHTPAGSIEVVFGGEASMEKAFSGSPNNPLDAKRRSYAAFAEARAPMLAGHGADPRELLTLTGALRYDHYSDFGDKTSPQLGVELRPNDVMLFRGTYSRAFRPPSLLSLYRPLTATSGTAIDPLRGNATTIVSFVRGGNPDLQPTTANFSSAGLVYSPRQIPHLDITLTWWAIHLKDGVGTPSNQTIISNEAQFPGRVHRAPPSTSDIAAGQPGPITAVDATALNFGISALAGRRKRPSASSRPQFRRRTRATTRARSYRAAPPSTAWRAQTRPDSRHSGRASLRLGGNTIRCRHMWMRDTLDPIWTMERAPAKLATIGSSTPVFATRSESFFGRPPRSLCDRLNSGSAA